MTTNAVVLSKDQVENLRIEANRLLVEEYSLPGGGGPTWHPSHFGSNCLPVHLALLPKIKKMGIGAAPGLVIGGLIGIDQTLSSKSIEHLESKAIFDDSIKSGYHAWISLNINDPNSDIVDLTGPSWDLNGNIAHYYNKEYAANCKRQHVAVLTEPEDVYDFVSRFVYNRFHSIGTPKQIERNVDSMLRRISELHDVPYDTVIGHWGRSIQKRKEKKETIKQVFDRIKKLNPFSRTTEIKKG